MGACKLGKRRSTHEKPLSRFLYGGTYFHFTGLKISLYPSGLGDFGLKLCIVNDCNGKHRAKGYCGKHYKQWRNDRLGKTDPRDGAQGCRVIGCESQHEAIGFCSKHYKRFRRGTLGLDGSRIDKKSICRVSNCSKEIYMKGYCERHFNRLLLMKDLWQKKIMPAYSDQSEKVGGRGIAVSKVVVLEEIRADLDFDYVREEDYRL